MQALKEWTEIPDDLLIVRGRANRTVGPTTIRRFMDGLVSVAGMVPVTETKVFDSEKDCPGYSAFRLWKTSGVTLYHWEEARMVTVVVHVCKPIDMARAREFILDYWEMDEYAEYAVRMQDRPVRRRKKG